VNERPEIPDDSALQRLFRREDLQGQLTWFALAGGQTLYAAGDPADQLYLLCAGRLGVFQRQEAQAPHFLGVVRPGEPVGEMALIAGAPHSADVVALRDSELVALPRAAFLQAADDDGAVMGELARLMILRMRQSTNQAPAGEPSVFGFVGFDGAGLIRPLVEQVKLEIVALGYSVVTAGAEAAGAGARWFSEIERDHDFVLYVAEAEETGWSHMVARQVDRLFRIGRGDQAAPELMAAASAGAAATQGLVDLILLQPRDLAAPQGSAAWMAAAGATRLFHLREGEDAHVKRLARIIAGQSVGLVLSGGGARAYAHIGAVMAMRARGVPIDFVGGVSMGAIIAAGVAMGWEDAEMEARIRDAFVTSNPLDDIALPLIAMTRGKKVETRLVRHFGDANIADLWLPFFCLSSNLTTGAYQLHRRGRLRDALRASISLPGVLPPATDGDNVLVDGAVLKNFPADVMRASQLGPVVGVDVGSARSITAQDVARPESVWRWLWSGQWRKGPPIVSLLMRTATVSSDRDAAAAQAAADVLILPDVTKTEIRDWSAYEPAVKAGYEATIAVLDQLSSPVQGLRRRQSLAEVAQAGAEKVAPENLGAEKTGA
jgi:NTE family protein